MMTRRQLVCRMTDAPTAQKYDSFKDVEAAVARAYPHAHKEGASGGWSWTAYGKCVAASAMINSYPYGRHWLAIRPR